MHSVPCCLLVGALASGSMTSLGERLFHMCVVCCAASSDHFALLAVPLRLQVLPVRLGAASLHPSVFQCDPDVFRFSCQGVWNRAAN